MMRISRFCIEIKDLEFVGFHGVYASERERGNRFKLDVILETEDLSCIASDDVCDAVNYESVVEALMEICEGPGYHLLESLCHRLSERCLEFTGVRRAQVSVYKSLRVLRGHPEWVGVSLEVER